MQHRVLHRLCGAITMCIALAVATGCAPIEVDSTEQDSAQAADPADADPNATIRYADATGPSRFDPHRSTVGQDIRFLAPVYDRLVHIRPDGELTGGLARDWEWDDSGTVLTMWLREGVRFHDGTAFNAEAVRANIHRGQTLTGSSVSADLEVIDRVDVVDDATVRLHLSKRSSMLPGLLSHRAGAIVSPAAFDKPNLDSAPVGAGMYRVTQYHKDDVIVYERNEDYWDESVVGARQIELDILSDDVTRLNAIRTGEVDIALIGGRQIAEAEQAGLVIQQDRSLTYLVLYLNRARAEFDKLLVRRALNHAIDREAIANGITFGASEPSVQPFPEGYFAHNPDYPGDYYEYNPRLARQLLRQAGVPNGFSFEMLVAALPPYTQVGEAVQNMLGEVGIDARIRAVEAAQTADVYYAQEQGDALLAQWGGRPDPSMTIELQFTANGFSNPGGHTTPEMTELHTTALNTIDEDARTEVLRRNVGEIVEQAFQVPVASDQTTYATTTDVVGFQSLITGQPDFRTLGKSG
ncbi:ABC transporter substrate-binding protein [Tamaricihabitans halophyticus]|nr:ABC transporter substrate-binding protein [Tamaricihabitans halophyticus]